MDSNIPTLHLISGYGPRLIKTDKPFSYTDTDVYCEYEGVRVNVTPIERV